VLVTTGYARDPVTEVDSQAWLDALRGPGGVREAAIADLHALLLRGAHFELHRRGMGHDEREDLAVQAADDALVAVLGKLDDFRGASRFTTWAYKFVLLEAGVKARRRAWQGREISLEIADGHRLRATGRSVEDQVEDAEVLRAIRAAITDVLTPHQREVFVALALNEVPIDVLAERLGSTRGALYKTLHDARRKLRSALAAPTGGAP
jgi:RNA polymerase sigma-70 factor (ECF subfamily)